MGLCSPSYRKRVIPPYRLWGTLVPQKSYKNVSKEKPTQYIYKMLISKAFVLLANYRTFENDLGWVKRKKAEWDHMIICWSWSTNACIDFIFSIQGRRIVLSRKNPLPPKHVDNKLKGQASGSGTMRRYGLQSLQRRGRHLRNKQTMFFESYESG